MNSFELNKVLGALLGCVLITLSLNIAAGALFAAISNFIGPESFAVMGAGFDVVVVVVVAG